MDHLKKEIADFESASISLGVTWRYNIEKHDELCIAGLRFLLGEVKEKMRKLERLLEVE